MFFLGVISKNAFSFKRWKGRYHPKTHCKAVLSAGLQKDLPLPKNVQEVPKWSKVFIVLCVFVGDADCGTVGNNGTSQQQRPTERTRTGAEETLPRDTGEDVWSC